MPPHGFVTESIMDIKKPGSGNVTMLLKSSDKTKLMYPYDFVYYINYKLNGNEINITYSVENLDSVPMYFGIGGHPGFNVSLEPGFTFNDYYLDFENEISPTFVGMTENCFVSGNNRPFSLINNRFLNLSHNMFNNDAIILTSTSRKVSLLSSAGRKSISLFFPQMVYLGLWHKPKTDAPYICIEPWTSLPSRQDIVENFETQENLIHLQPVKFIITHGKLLLIRLPILLKLL